MNFSINLNRGEATRMWYDITKFITIGITIHFLLYAIDDYEEIFTEKILKLFLYLVLGIIFYHLIIKKIVDKYIIKKNNNVENYTVNHKNNNAENYVINHKKNNNKLIFPRNKIKVNKNNKYNTKNTKNIKKKTIPK